MIPTTQRTAAARALVVSGALLGAAAHLAGAFTGADPAMAITMVLMGLACASCLLHAGRGGACTRSAGHLMLMAVAMLAVHAAWLLLPGTGSVHVHGTGAAGSGTVSHAGVMGLMMLAEFVALCAASAALRLAAAAPPRPIRNEEPSA